MSSSGSRLLIATSYSFLEYKESIFFSESNIFQNLSLSLTLLCTKMQLWRLVKKIKSKRMKKDHRYENISKPTKFKKQFSQF